MKDLLKWLSSLSGRREHQAIIETLTITIILCGSIFTVSEALVRFSFIPAVYVHSNFVFFSVALFVPLVLGLLFTCYRLVKACNVIHHPDSPTEIDRLNRFSDELLRTINCLLDERRFAEAERLAIVLNRPLWLSGQYIARMRAGKQLLIAVEHTGNKEAQLDALVDMTGWTNVILKNYPEAQENLEAAVQIASDCNNWYMKSKALRHLGGLYYEQESFDLRRASDYLTESVACAQNVASPYHKHEMLGGIFYGFAEIAYRRGDFDEAIVASAQSLDHYGRAGPDVERQIKVLLQQGRIWKAKQQLGKAKSHYLRAHGLSVRWSRPRLVAQALQGLAEVESDDQTRMGYLERADRIFRGLELS